MSILKYICFKSSEDFEKWQLDNPSCKVHHISPLVSGIDLQFDSTEKDNKFGANATTNVSAFVIYAE